MNRELRIASFGAACFTGLAAFIIFSAWSFEPFVSAPPKQYPIGSCPDCHLVKQPPDPCPDLTGSEWEACTDAAHRHPDE